MRYVAEFSPQAWVNDYAIPVDPEGPTTWDATEWVEAFLNETPVGYSAAAAWRGRAARSWLEATLEHGDYDDILRTDPNAPEWVREWSGPFDTYLTVVE